jgi:hypothetical protein
LRLIKNLGACPEILKTPATDSVALKNEASPEVLNLKRIKNRFLALFDV